MTTDMKRILIVDNEPEFINTVRRHLKREGFLLDTATDGLKAKEQIEQSLLEGNPVQVVITDVMMPRMNGLELMEWVKNFHEKISLLAVSGFAEAVMVKKLIRPEMDEYCQKPFTPNKMMTLLSSIRQKRQNYLMSV